MIRMMTIKRMIKSIKSWQGAMLLAGLEGEKVEAAKQLGSHLALALRLALILLKVCVNCRTPKVLLKKEDWSCFFLSLSLSLSLTNTYSYKNLLISSTDNPESN